MSLADSISAVVQSVVIPYGYTLSIWSAGMMAVLTYGATKRMEPMLFVVGAVTGFMVFNIPTYRSLSDQELLEVHVPSVALLNVVPLLAVVTSVILVRRIRNRWVGYFLSGFTATVVYIASLSLLLWGLG